MCHVSDMSKQQLTAKQEKAIQEYMSLRDKTAAYRSAYNCENMKPATINRRAKDFFDDGKIKARVDQLEAKLLEKNMIKADDVIKELACTAFIDPALFFDEHGKLLSIKEIPEYARRAIASIKVRKEFSGETDEHGKKIFDDVVEIKTNDKLKALELLGKTNFLKLFTEENNSSETIVNVTIAPPSNRGRK